MTDITVYPLTAINRGTGEVEIHRVGCRDLKRNNKGAAIWDIAATSLQSVVEDVFSDMIGEHSAEGDTWKNYIDGLKIIDCCPGLPFAQQNVTNTDGVPVEAPEEDVEAPVKTTRARHPHTGCGHDLTPAERSKCRAANRWNGTAWVPKA